MTLWGKLLLVEVIKYFGLEEALPLRSVKYGPYNRPFFEHSAFDFNISHAGEYAVCAGTLNNRVGIDIEMIKEINVLDFKNCFTKTEWDLIRRDKKRGEVFYETWTKKEAVLKSIGMGLHDDLSLIETTSGIARYLGKDYHIYPLKSIENYAMSVATAHPICTKDIYVIEIEFKAS